LVGWVEDVLQYLRETASLFELEQLLVKSDLGPHLLLCKVLLRILLLLFNVAGIILVLINLLFFLNFLILSFPIEEKVVNVVANELGIVVPHRVHIHKFFQK
jgi:hypothetical protein